MRARAGKWSFVSDQRVQQLQRQVRVKEERIIELETENAILHLKLAEKLKQDIKELHSSSLILVRNYQGQYQDCLSGIVAAIQRTQLYNETLQAYQSRAVLLEQSLQEINEQYQIEKQKRKLLHNSLVELKGNIRVHCRIRPLLPFDNELDDPVLQNSSLCEKVIHAVDDETVLVKCNRPGHPLINKTYNFERVYGPAESQRIVFEEMRPLLISLLDGYNVCVMAYGQTGSGKSYTMLGPYSKDEPALPSECHDDLGIIPRAAEELFRLISENPSRSPRVEVSIVEVYNNEIFDLLAKDSSTLVSGVKRDVITSREGKKELLQLTSESVSSAGEFMNLVTGGLQLRAKHPTWVHADSSRSHLVITATLTAAASPGSAASDQMPLKAPSCPSPPPSVRGERPRAARRASSPGPAPVGPAEPLRQAQARLQLVDLAGSECIGASGVTGLARRETSCINRSLAALADVLGALAEHRGHVPYRNSKLTHFLQDSIGGDAKLLVILCVSPCQKSLAETLQCLGFGTRARRVQRGQAKRRGFPASGKPR
ncbi:kinesin-like protein KIF25 isoform X2 [Dasypus novemcinctus]|uniref:kinesin-like protein KIF25 isoform X2 n=1 Tax=Dasypus novemcinctus TaxID=9361 RepID=UPI000C8279C6|nr:kinesin-like protein KIF25 isoform X2 [Dasypus novemcinctus]